jgi:hypothetical protein
MSSLIIMRGWLMNEEPADNAAGQSREEIPGLPDFEAAAALAEPVTNDPAQAEAAQLSEGLTKDELEKRAEVAEHGRTERFRDHFERLAIFALWVSAIAIALVGSVWLLHMVLPCRYRWLSTEDLSHIQSIVTTGLLVGVIGNHFRKRLS